MKFSFKSTLIVGTLAVAAAAMSFGAGADPIHHRINNIVLVHGAFTDQTSWDQVAEILRRKGYRVTEVDNPTTSLANDEAATNEALSRQDGPVVLVGHSWGGFIIGETGNDIRVKALVYIAAFAPDRGETLGALSASGPATPGVLALQTDAKGNLYFPRDAFDADFCGDCKEVVQDELYFHQIPFNPANFESPAAVAAWHDKPSYYAISANDKFLAPQAEQFFATRMMAKTVTLPSSHASPASHAEDVAALIERAADECQ